MSDIEKAPKPGRIKTPDQRVRVFVSSTLKELAAEREIARRAISRLRLAPVMFELGARPHLARDLYRAYIEQSHIFVGIYAEQYGWVAPNASISGLEEEYLLAEKLPRLIYIRRPVPNRDPRLTRMLTDIRDRDGISYKYFSTVEELGELIEADLALLLAESFDAANRLTAGRDTPDTQASKRPGTRESMPPELLAPAPAALPFPETRLVGREPQLASATELLSESGARLVSFTGPGGTGKTRLAIEVAHRHGNEFDRVVYVDLAPVRDAAVVADQIARSLGISEAGSMPVDERIIRTIGASRWLLVLDNFEQVLPAASLVAEIRRRCPAARLIVTSRSPLQIRGEHEIPVPPLTVPDGGAGSSRHESGGMEAVELFADRVRAIRPEFALTDETLPTVIEICRKLDGLPLAIELAAPRLRSLSLTELLSRLGSRLSLLQEGPHDLPARQRTMRDTIGWSYDLLEDAEAVLFRRMAVFIGGGSLSAIATVCDDEVNESATLEALDGLVVKNLVRRVPSPEGESRFGMLETIREYANELLVGEQDRRRVAERHAEFYVGLGETAEPELKSRWREVWLRRLDLELDNIRAVLHRSVEGSVDPAFGIRLAGTLGWYWHLRGHLTEGRGWANALRRLPEAQGRTRLRAKVLFPAGGLAWSQGDYDDGNVLLAESAEIFREVGDRRGLTEAQAILAGGVASVGDYQRAIALCRENESMLRAEGQEWGLAFTLLWHGATLVARSAPANEAEAMLEESLTLAGKLADPWLYAEALNHLGAVAALQGRLTEAQEYFRESRSYHDRTGDRWNAARSLSGEADVLIRGERYEEAVALLRECTEVWREMANGRGLLVCLSSFAEVAAHTGELERAARLFGAAPSRIRTVGYLFLPTEQDAYEGLIERTRKELGQSAFRRHYRFGAHLSLDDAVQYALTDTGSAGVA